MRRLCATALSILLAMSWLVSPLTVSTAEAVTPAKPSASPGHPVRGVAFRVAGRLPTKVARPVSLQRKSGSKWVTIASARTTSSGRYSFPTSLSSSSAQLRVYAAKVKIGKKTYSRLTSKVNKVRTVLVTPTSPMPGETFTVVESLGRKGSRTAKLQALSGKKWVTIKTAKSNSAGTATFTASLSSSKTLRVYAPKTKIKKKTYSKITVASFRVTTTAQTGSLSLPTSGLTGQALVAKATFTPARAGRTVELQQLSGSSWVRVATGTQDASGKATVAVAPSTEGTFTYRAVAVAYQGAPATATGTARATIASGVAEPSILIGALTPAVSGDSYNFNLKVVGGTAPFTWAATGLPEGMELSKDGLLSGTPTTPGTYEVTISLTDSRGKSARSTTTITVLPPVGVDSTQLPDGIAGQDYTASLTASGGTQPYHWTAEGLPSGLNLSEDGVITGTAGAAGEATVTVTVTDDNGKTASKELTLTVGAALALTTTELPSGTVGADYSATLAATGGASPYTWSQTGLPDGLSLNETTGVISGTPTQAGTFDAVTLTVTDDNGYADTTTVTVVIAAVFAISTASLPGGVVGTTYADTTLTTVAGTGPFTWSATTLPAGLSLDTTTGVISGTPTESGTFDAVTITVSDSTGKNAESTFSIAIAPAVIIDKFTLPDGVVGTAYPETTLTAAYGNSANYTWSSTTLPAGLTLSSSGTITGTPTESGTFDAVTITVADADGKTAEATVSLTIAPAVIIDKFTLPDGVVGTAYPETTLTAAYGNSANYTWSSTTLPAGLTLSSSGTITGTPTESGTFDAVTITVADADGKTAEATVSLTIAPALHITTTSLPDGVVDTAYPETTLNAADGNSASYTWSSTTLPAGLSLSEAGVLTGTPTADGTTEITVTVTDAAGKTATAELSITIAKAVHITTASLPAGVVGTDYPETTLTAADGHSGSYFWVADHLPDGLSFNGNTGVLSGVPTAAGTFDAVTFTVTDEAGKTAEATYTIAIAPAVHITTTTLPDGVVGTTYTTTTLTAADGNSDSYTWTSTTLPDGLSLSSSGKITGTPTSSGVYENVTITVTDGDGKTAEATFSVTIAQAVHITTASLPAGVVGTDYPDTTLAAADGTGPYSWSSTTLPDGLTLSTSGVLSGTPTASGTFDSITVTATDANSKTAEATFTITITPAVHITTASLPVGVVGTDYTATLTGADGTSPYTWASTTLPAGLTLSAAGAITGVPTEAGTFDAVKVTATDANGKTAEATFTVTIAPAVHITTASLPAGVVGTDYPDTTLAAADGNSATYTWTSTTLPDGLSLSSTGVITGTPTSSGVFDAVKLTVADADGKTAEATFTITIAPAVHITTASLPAGVVGTDYPDTTLEAADGNGSPYTWTSTGLPTGLTLSEAGTITGIPTAAGTFDAVKVTATDNNGKTAEATFTVTITPGVQISTPSLPAGVVGTDYPETTLTAANGTAPYTWASTSMPAGLTLSETGTITGTPTVAGASVASITATDANGKHAHANFIVVIAPAVTVSTSALPLGVVGTDYTATVTASGGTIGYTWQVAMLPAGLSLNTNTGEITGIPTTSGTSWVAFTVTDGTGKTAYRELALTVKPAVHITTSSLPTAVAGTAYTATLAAADGTGPYTWSATGLPMPLTLSADGTISGTPGSAGVFDEVTITATDANGKTASFNPTLTVIPAVHITTTSLPSAVVGTDYETTLAAADGTSPYTWTATDLPEGLTMSESGTITGTPAASASVWITATVTDDNGKVANRDLQLVVAPAVHLTTTQLPDGVLEEAYPDTTVAAADGTGPYTWTATGLPEGISLNTSTGVLSGTPVETGTFDAVAITATDANHKTATKTFTITVHGVVAVTTAELAPAVVNEDYSATLAALGGTTPYTWAVTGLPSGIELNTSTGDLTGTATETGPFELGVTVTDAHAKTASATATLTVRAQVHVTMATIPNGVVGTEYSGSISAGGGTSPYSWTSTALPAGLLLSQGGVLSGTPSAAGVTPVTVTVTDAHGTQSSTDISLTITPAVHITTTSLPSAVVGTDYSATLEAADGNGAATWSSTALPAGLSLDQATGVLSGAPEAAGTTAVTFTATDPEGKTATWDTSLVVAPAVHITTDALPAANQGESYSVGLAAADGTSAYTWSSSDLPSGLTLDSESGTIAGTPTQAGTFDDIQLTVTDANHKTDSITVSLTVIPAVHVTTATLPSVEAGDAYLATTLEAADGTAPYSWTVDTLPEGLTLTDGVIAGTPTTAGTTTVAVTVTDTHSQTATAELTITVTAAAHLTSTLSIGVVGGDYTTTLTADGGTAPYTYAATTTLPDGLSLSGNTITGTPTAASANTPVEFTVSDKRGKTSTTTLDLTVVKPKTVSAGISASCAITQAGGVECWGVNTYGQLGDGSITTSAYPVKVIGLDAKAISVTISLNHACALLSTGKVECWGSNDYGQLGTEDSIASSTTAVEVAGITSAVSISAGQRFTCATLQDGTASCWGTGAGGQIGNGDSVSVSQPTAVQGLTKVMDVEAGGSHACALTTEGTVSCWGRNASRQIGAGGTAETSSYDTPVAVPDVSNVVSLSAHMGSHTCVATNTGVVKCWGNNPQFQLGTTTVTTSGPALTVPDISDAVEVVSGGAHSCAINAAGAMRCWGANASGQLGAGSSVGTNSATPVTVGITDPVANAAGGSSHTCARTTTGTLTCWGGNSNSQLGNGTTTDSSTPVEVVGFDAAPLAADSVNLAAGVAGTAYADHQLTASGGVAPYTWTATGLPAGLSVSTDGALSGTPTEAGTSEVTFTITDVRGKKDSTTASITITPAVHITSDAALPGGVVGTVYSTQLQATDGIGPYTWSSDVVPAGLTLSQDGVLSGTPTASTVSTTMQITATDNNGKTATQAFTIVITPVIHGAAALSAGTYATCAVTDAGGVECWGKNDLGQLGNGTTTASAIPTQVSGLSSGVQTVVVGASHACALTDAGGVKCWGTNQLGQLGNGSTTGTHEDGTPYISTTPVDVAGLTSGVKAIGAGTNHTCAVTNAGALKCWGYNTAGQLGNNSKTDSSIPVQAISSGAVAVSGGNSSTCALTDAGGVKCWGYNNKGQVGIDTSTLEQLTPVDVPDLSSGVASLSVGGKTACAVMTDGGLKCWGNNANGQLGVDSTITPYSVTPVVPPGVPGAKQVATAISHACVLATTGGVLCWGDNTYGQLGDDTTTSRAMPAAVEGLSSGVGAVSTNLNRSCALLDNGSVKCWGINDVGQLGDGSLTDSHTPADVFGYGSVPIHIATSGLPVGEVGTAYPATKINLSGGNAPYAWSASGLPDGLSINTSTGVISGTPLTATVATVSVAANDAGGHTVFADLSLTIVSAVHITTTSLPNGAVGTGYYAQLQAADGAGVFYNWSSDTLPAGLTLSSWGTLSGTPTTATVATPVTVTVTDEVGGTATQTYTIQITGATQAVAMSAQGGTAHSCALTASGGVECWGSNTYGQLGNGTNTNSLGPVSVSGLSTGVVSVVNGGAFSCALTDAGAVKCWGRNTVGQLGNQTNTDQNTPTDVVGLSSGVTAIGAGTNHVCAVLTTGAVSCWGLGTGGQLGDGNLTNSNIPVSSLVISGATQVVGGSGFTCALVNGGEQCWGSNATGQLGNNSTNDSSFPVTVAGLDSGVASISAYAQSACAVTTTGAAKCWGYNNVGQLGNNSTINQSAPVDVSGLTSGVADIAVGANHACAVTTAGAVKCWGANTNGQLGDGTLNSSTIPMSVSSLDSGVRQVTAGMYRTCAVLATGGVKCWGAGESGQLGDGGTPVSNPNPVDVFGYGATPVSITTTSVPSGSVGSAYAGATLAATGGTSPYTWTAWGLPTGLSLSSAGVLSGTPSAAGSWPDVTVWVADSAGNRSATTFTMTVSPAPAITTSSLADGVVNSTYANPAMAATGGDGTYSWTATNLPTGITLSTAGEFGGKPTASGTKSVVLTVTDGRGATAQVTLTLKVLAALSITTSSLSGGHADAAYSSPNMVAAGGTTPYSWGASGQPSGITLSSAGVWGGTGPSIGGTWTVTVTVTDSGGRKATRTYSMYFQAAIG